MVFLFCTYTRTKHSLGTGDSTINTTAKDTTLGTLGLSETSLDTTLDTSASLATWLDTTLSTSESTDASLNSTLDESIEVNDPEQTKLFKLRALRIESKHGTTSKFVLKSVVASKQRKQTNTNCVANAVQANVSIV